MFLSQFHLYWWGKLTMTRLEAIMTFRYLFRRSGPLLPMYLTKPEFWVKPILDLPLASGHPWRNGYTSKEEAPWQAVAQGPTFHFPFSCVKFFRNKGCSLGHWNFLHHHWLVKETSTSFSSTKQNIKTQAATVTAPGFVPPEWGRVTRASQFLYNLLEIPTALTGQRMEAGEEIYHFAHCRAPIETLHSQPRFFQTGDFL